MSIISPASSLKTIKNDQEVSQLKDKVQDSKVSKLALGLLFGSGVGGIAFTVVIAAFMFSPLAPIAIPIELIILGVVGGLVVSGVAAKVGFAVFNRPKQIQGEHFLPESPIQGEHFLPESTLSVPTNRKKNFIINELEKRLEILKKLDAIHQKKEELEARCEDPSITQELKNELKNEITKLLMQMGEANYHREDGKILGIGKDKANGLLGELQDNERNLLQIYPDYEVLKDFARARTLIYIQRDSLLDAENVSSVDKSNRGEAQWIIDQLRDGKFKVDQNNCFVSSSYAARIDDEKKPEKRLDSSLQSSPDNYFRPNQSDDLNLN